MFLELLRRFLKNIQFRIKTEEKIDDEKIEKNDYFVRGIISLSGEDINQIEKKFSDKFNGIQNIQFSQNINLNGYINKLFNEFLIKINIGDNEKPNYARWAIDDKNMLRGDIFLSGNNIVLENGNEFDLEMEIFTIVKEHYSNNPINCHFWLYNESFLLPSKINIQEFKDNPSRYNSLENIFLLCGKENISYEFETAMKEDQNYQALLRRISKDVTNKFQKIWPDLKKTSIELLPNGPEIDIQITNKTTTNCDDRSDGFKKFISILLMLSTKSMSEKINEKDLILIDEPDQSLYPTSVKYLRDELLKISKKSKVIYSTHSQYMIDTDNLDRHIVVEKVDDITILKKEDNKSPYIEDELLKRAIGAAIFECLKPINIIFEGYLDKKLFEKYCKFHKKEKIFNDYGKIYSHGNSEFGLLISLLESINKKFIIVADSDKASNGKRKYLEDKLFDFKLNWLAYGDVDKIIVTMEDFFDKNFVKSEIEKINKDYVYDDSKHAIFNIDKASINNNKQEIKNNIVKNFKREDITNIYEKYIEELIKKLNDINKK